MAAKPKPKRAEDEAQAEAKARQKEKRKGEKVRGEREKWGRVRDGGQAEEWGKRGRIGAEGKDRKRRAGRTNKSLGPVLPKDAADAMGEHPRARGRGHEGVHGREELAIMFADPPG